MTCLYSDYGFCTTLYTYLSNDMTSSKGRFLKENVSSHKASAQSSELKTN